MNRALTLTFALLFSTPVLADDDGDEGIRPADLPADVIAAVATQAPGAEILSAEREHGRYEVRVRTADGATRELDITPTPAASPKAATSPKPARAHEREDEDEDEDERGGEREDAR